MNRGSRFQGDGLRPFLAACACAALMQGALFAEGVTRAVEPVPGGCRVTLAWEFSGRVESDLILEERFAPGWTVDGATVPFGSLDASWLSGSVARFAVKPSLLAQAGSISFTVVADGASTSGMVAGDWKMYLDGSLRKGTVAGAVAVASLGGAATDGTGTAGDGAAGTPGSTGAGTGIAITAFKMTDGATRVSALSNGAGARAQSGGTLFEFAYAGLERSGTLVVEGCETLGGAWTAVKRVAASAGDGTVALTPGEAGDNRFFRLKFVAEEE